MPPSTSVISPPWKQARPRAVAIVLCSLATSKNNLDFWGSGIYQFPALWTCTYKQLEERAQVTVPFCPDVSSTSQIPASPGSHKIIPASRDHHTVCQGTGEHLIALTCLTGGSSTPLPRILELQLSSVLGPRLAKASVTGAYQHPALTLSWLLGSCCEPASVSPALPQIPLCHPMAWLLSIGIPKPISPHPQ